MTLSAASLLYSCKNADPKNNLVLIDISGSNLSTIDKTLDKVYEVYSESMPSDTFEVYFFSSVKYLAFSGQKLNKDRDFLPILKAGLEKAKKIKVNEGTSFSICKNVLENSKDYDHAFLFTDGFFENSKLETIKLNEKSNIRIVGLSIENNERILNSLSDPKKATIDFQGN